MELYTLVTGCTSEVGIQIASVLSEKYNLILHGRNSEKISATLALCSLKHKHIPWVFDLEDADSIEGSLQELIKAHGISIVNFVHAAGLFSVAPLRLTDNSLLNSFLKVNCISAYAICRTLSKRSVNTSHAKSIVFLSSVSSVLGVPGFSAYAASKGALDSVMRTLAVELSPHTRVNSVLPGAIRTAKLSADAEEAALKTHPLGVGTPADVANMVDYLLSDSARWITGQQFTVDGGYSCR